MIAGLVDLALAGCAAIPMGMVLLRHCFANSPVDLWNLPALMLSIAVATLYEVVAGRSLGKIFTGLYVRKRFGGSPSVGILFARSLLKYAPVYVYLLLLWTNDVLFHLGYWGDHRLPVWDACVPIVFSATLLVPLASWLLSASSMSLALHDLLTGTRVSMIEPRGFPVEPAE